MNKFINFSLAFLLVSSLALNVTLATLFYGVNDINTQYKEHLEVIKKRSQVVNEENHALHTAMKDFASYTTERDAEIANLKEENKTLYFQLENELAKQTKWF